MNTYIIKYVQNKIFLFKFNNNYLEPLKDQGENVLRYSLVDFWVWFKNKVEYKETEEISLLILQDAEFIIDPAIKIAQEHALSTDEIDGIIAQIDSSEILEVYTYPSVRLENRIDIPSINLLENKNQGTIIDHIFEDESRIDTMSIQAYYKKKTKEYKGKK